MEGFLAPEDRSEPRARPQLAPANRGGGAEYAWEKAYERTWEHVEEDESGRLVDHVRDAEEAAAVRQQRSQKSVRRGMLRHVIVIVDMSSAMNRTDYRPTRLKVVRNILVEFVEQFFDQNPISQLGIITTQNSTARDLTQLASNPKHQIQCLRSDVEMGVAEGSMSIYNALQRALLSLKFVPSYASREIIFLHAAISSCDAGDVAKLIRQCAAQHIRCSVIGLGGEMRIMKKLTEDTGGTFHVPMDKSGLRRLVLRHVVPPPQLTDEPAQMVLMGFPEVVTGLPGIDAKTGEIVTDGYTCPQCHSRVTDVPTACPVCKLQLLFSAQLAASYHHLFPVRRFKEDAVAEGIPSLCGACQHDLQGSTAFRCLDCSSLFCSVCDNFIHDSLHNCPGCV